MKKFILAHEEFIPTSVVRALSAELQTELVSGMDSSVLLSWAGPGVGHLNALASAARQAAAQRLACNIGELDDAVVVFVVRELA